LVPFSFIKSCGIQICSYVCTVSGIKSTGSSYSCSICTEEEYEEKNPRANPTAYSFTDSSLSVIFFKPAFLLLQPMCHTETAELAKHLQRMCHTETAGFAKRLQPMCHTEKAGLAHQLQPCHNETAGLPKHLQTICHTQTAGLAKHQPLVYCMFSSANGTS
jgi:hypothetical protein